jgi:putative copper resistance protein D
MNDCSLADALNRETWATVLFQTHFGAVSEWRLGFALLLAVLLALPAWKNWPFQNRRTPLEIMVGMLALALTISPAGTGHAAASGSGIFSLHIAADGLHLLAASIWPTGLLPFALLLRNWGRNSEPNVTGPIIIAVHRFSNLSLFIVVVLIITGFINSLFLVGTFSAMVMTDYGRLLCLKLALFMVILACAGWNRFRLLPLLSARDETAVLPRLRLFVAVEFGLAVVIVGVVSILGITPPPG